MDKLPNVIPALGATPDLFCSADTLIKIPMDIPHILSYSIISPFSCLPNESCKRDGLWRSFIVVLPVTQ